jgi:hypothetical protein
MNCHGVMSVSGFKPSFTRNGVQAVSADDAASTTARGAQQAKQRALQIHGPVEFPKYIRVDGKDVLALTAAHEMELRNRAGVIDPASCEPRLPRAEGDQISAPIEPPPRTSVFSSSFEGEKIDIAGDRASVLHAGESTSDSAQLVRTSLERIGAPVSDKPHVDKPHVLLPFDIREALSISDAARIAGRTIVTVRAWAANFDLGRPVGGRWMISRVALAMFLESDRLALTAYLSGDRESRLVVAYFARFGLDPKKIEKERIN